MFVVLQKEKVAVGQYYNSYMGNKTIEYYNANAQGFASSTITADMFDNCQVFEALLPHGAYILDFGCGSGRNVSKLRLDIFEGMVKNRNIELLLRSWIAAHAGS